MNECVFCKIIKGELPCYKIYEDEYTLAFLDISKDCYGHTLVIPKKHFENILDCDEECLSYTMKTVKKIAKHYVENCGFKGVNILNANGVEAQQSVFHLHFHILPRKDNAEYNAFPQLFGTDVDFEEQLKHLKIK